MVTFEGENIPKERLPIPSGWRVLIGMLKVEERTAGGIILTDEHIKGRGYLRFIGKVLAAGPDCYKDPKFQSGISIKERSPEPWAKVGDIVMIGQYGGQNITCQYGDDTHTLKLLNDDEILAVIPDIDIINT